MNTLSSLVNGVGCIRASCTGIIFCMGPNNDRLGKKYAGNSVGHCIKYIVMT